MDRNPAYSIVKPFTAKSVFIRLQEIPIIGKTYWMYMKVTFGNLGIGDSYCSYR